MSTDFIAFSRPSSWNPQGAGLISGFRKEIRSLVLLDYSGGELRRRKLRNWIEEKSLALRSSLSLVRA
jgi:hypothetical protein